MFQPAFCGSDDTSDFSWLSIFHRFLIFTTLCFVALGVMRFLFIFPQVFIRGLFTRQGFKLFLMRLAFLVVLILLFYAEEDCRGKRAWENFKHAREAEGEKFDFASTIPPPVGPDDKNFALTPIVASCYEGAKDENGKRIYPDLPDATNRLKMSFESEAFLIDEPTNYLNATRGTKGSLKDWQVYYQLLASKTNEFPVPRQPQAPALDVLFALSKYDSAIEELRQASHRPLARFPINYNEDDPFGILLVHLISITQPSHRIFEKSAGTICLALPHGRDE